MENADLDRAMPRNPAEAANPLSKLLFWYVIPVFMKSRKKEIGMEDLYQAMKAHKSDGLGDRMCAAWEKELVRAKGRGKEPSLLRAAMNVFGWYIAALGLVLASIEFLLR